MVERKLKSGKNPNRVAAGKKAWRKAHRGGAKMTKRKRGSVRRGYSRAKATLGRTIKAIVILAPAVAFGVGGYTRWHAAGGSKRDSVIAGLGAFGSCYTGMAISGDGTVIQTWKNMAIGWGPPLVIGGVQYGLRAVHMQGANPFRIMSQLG